ncbi:MAG TPA: hypothetical protein VGY30_12445 [Solirubrobacteraceae bacterium]|nr:hypothetical protein [Solirubrobacteraceae bacterium]
MIEEGIRSVGYHDADDVRITGLGHAAGHAETRAIASVVYSYQAANATGNARRACALVTKPVYRAVGPDYDKTPSHRTRHSKTCAGGMVFLFKTYPVQMTAHSTVTSVRIKGREAYALVGSPTARAGYFMLEREHGRWRISVLLTLGLS